MIPGQEGERPYVWTWDSWRWGFPGHSRTQGCRHPEPALCTSLEDQGELSFAWTPKQKGVPLPPTILMSTLFRRNLVSLGILSAIAISSSQRAKELHDSQKGFDGGGGGL